ncbi:MAG: hypothetical protein QNI87_00085 [Erythrobacter sp.]|uniref:hypothetical protein n=1 Tax=Erythrobacter sp. TaxID=1042 RepID=UPI0026058ACD|nr:hypothetical protein [Erythrobacter sp.]MDJ0976914.1 hypothetical protein [Erythrobacter sp.]
MSVFAILMFTTLTIALAVGIYQAAKVDNKLPDDTSHLKPERTLQRMDQAQADTDIRGTKSNPIEA